MPRRLCVQAPLLPHVTSPSAMLPHFSCLAGAALELGSASFWEVIETLFTSTALDFEVNLQKAAPDTSEEELHGCGRAIRRSICAALLDKSITPDELCGELRMLIDSHLSLASLSAQAHAGASERVSAPVTLS
jgi:hypothetical protein